MPITLIPIIIKLIQTGITLAPSIISAGRIEYDLITSGTEPTADEKATIDAALEEANNAVQAAQPAP